LTTRKPATTAATSPGFASTHADRDEKQPEQQALEGLEIGLQLTPVFALGQQHAGEERTQRHRQPHALHQRSRGHDQQQRRGGEDLGRLAARDPAQRGAQQQPAAEDDRRDHAEGLGRAEPAAAIAVRAAGRQQRHDGQDRDRRDVLQQRDAEHALAGTGGHQVALGENAQADRGRAHRQPQAGHDGQPPVRPRGQADTRDQCRRPEQLRAAPAEDRPSKRPQAARFEFEADQEQHQHDSEFGEVQHRLRVGHELQAPGPDRDAGAQVADDRAQAQQARQRHRQHGRAEVDQARVQPARAVFH
jgi:hypothetical protein